jgi:hypothetical protein
MWSLQEFYTIVKADCWGVMMSAVMDEVWRRVNWLCLPIREMCKKLDREFVSQGPNDFDFCFQSPHHRDIIVQEVGLGISKK